MYKLNLSIYSYVSKVALLYLLLDLTKHFEESYTSSPAAVELEHMYDIRDWIAPIKCELHNITNPHTFVIKKNEAGKIVLRYKHWSGDTEWLPSKDAGDGIEILKEVV